MADDDSDQEYEEIDKAGWKPFNRPPMPIYTSGEKMENMYASKREQLRRAFSAKESEDGMGKSVVTPSRVPIPVPVPVPNPVPPLPPPNSKTENTYATKREQFRQALSGKDSEDGTGRSSITPSRVPIPIPVPVPNPVPPLPPPNSKPVISTSRAPAPPPSLKQRSITISGADFPPEIPPKPVPRMASVSFDSNTIPKQRKKRLEDSFIIESEELSLEQFVSKYRDEFPLHVRVSKGFYGNSERTSVSEGDTFNIHFIKNTKVISMEDGASGLFKIAFNSGIEFGIMYDPNNKRDEALNGFTFEKASDLLQMKTLPKVVRVGATWTGSSSESAVEQNELLILKGWKRKLNGKVIKAYNPYTRAKKELVESCQGKFTTRPYDVRLYLTDIIEHVTSPLPSTAVLFVNSDSMSELPSYLITSVVKLKSSGIETTLVATAANVDEYVENEAVEIPFDLDIEVQVMRPKEQKDTEDLYMSTRKLLENFNKVKTSAYVTVPGRESSSEAQAAIYSIIREGRELAGVDIIKPSNIYNTPSPQKVTSVPKHSSRMKMTPSDSVFEESPDMVEQFGAIENRLDTLEKAMQQVEQKLASLSNIDDIARKVSRDVTSARADMKRMEARGNKAAEDAGKAKSDTTQLTSIVEHLSSSFQLMKDELATVKQSTVDAAASSVSPSQIGYMTLSHQRPMSSVESAYSTTDETTWEENRKFLASLDFVQILNLLECMGLQKHSKAFMEERVNGEILLECDNLVLQEELKVTSKLQRVRLMKLIEGKYSAENILRGEDPYGISVYDSAK